MKKLGILMMALILVGGFAFAQELTITGSATMTFGVDLNDPVSMGFKNEAASTATLTWLTADDSKGTQGVITLSSAAIKFASDDKLEVNAPSVTAKLVFEPISVIIYSAPTMSGSNATSFKYAAESDADDNVKAALSAGNTSAAAGTAPTSGEGTIQYVAAGGDAPTGGSLIGTTNDGLYDVYLIPVAADAATTASFQGVTISAAVSPLTVDILLVSDGNWTNTPQAEGNINDFAFGLKLSGTFGPAAVNAGVFAGPTDGLDIGLTAGMSGTFGPASVAFGVDGWMPEGGDFALDGKLDISAGLGPVTLGSYTYFWMNPDFDLDQQISLDASGAVEGLSFTETFQLANLLTADPAVWNSKTYVAYATGGIKPFATVIYYSSERLDLTAGVELTGFVENTTFTLQYDVDDVANDNGAITFATKIAY